MLEPSRGLTPPPPTYPPVPHTHIQRGLRPIPAPRRGAEGDIGAGAARRGPWGGHGAMLCWAAHGVKSGGVGRLHPAGGRQLLGQQPSAPITLPLLLFLIPPLTTCPGRGAAGGLSGGSSSGGKEAGGAKSPSVGVPGAAGGNGSG